MEHGKCANCCQAVENCVPIKNATNSSAICCRAADGGSETVAATATAIENIKDANAIKKLFQLHLT